MGCCMSDPNTTAIDKGLKQAYKADQNLMKLLLLGPGESGKTTLFKQMLTIYGRGISERDYQDYRAIIRNNTLRMMQTLIQQTKDLNTAVGVGDTLITDAATKKAAAFLEDLKYEDSDPFTSEIAKAIEVCWKDPHIRKVFNHRSHFQIYDWADHFFERAQSFVSDKYRPSYDDMIKTRNKSTGITESEFIIDGNRFRMVDVGGQRNERKKWFHAFEGVTTVIFVTAISEYDLKLFEDDSINRLDESLSLFCEVANSNYFKKTPVILFLNKRDLFEEKLKKTPLNTQRPEYNGPNRMPEAANYIQELFLKQMVGRQPAFVHLTCATDQNNVKKVFDDVKQIIFAKDLQEVGLFGAPAS